MQIDLILISGAVVIAYAALANRLFAFAGPSRDDFRDICVDLIKDPRVSDEQKHMVATLMVGIDRTRTAWFLVCALPAIIGDAVKGAGSNATPITDSFPADLKVKWARAARLFNVCVLCNSPAALVLFGIGIANASFIFSGARLAEKALGRVASRLDRDELPKGCPPSHPA